MDKTFAEVDRYPVGDLAIVAEALDLVNELWPVGGEYKTLTPDQWRRLRRVLLSVPTMVDE